MPSTEKTTPDELIAQNSSSAQKSTGQTRMRGRPSRAYRTTWGEEIHGLYHRPDGRWRIVATGKIFTEHDERRAIQKFQDSKKQFNVDVPTRGVTEYHELNGRQVMFISAETPGENFWPWLRELLISKPEWVAKMTGLPEVAGLRHLAIPGESLKLQTILDAYLKNNGSKGATKRKTELVWGRFVKIMGAATLADLTNDRLLAYRQQTETAFPSPSSRSLHYRKVKTVLAFALKMGMDAGQIRRALDACKVLWTAERSPAPQPAPISREDFHALLKAAERDPWKPWRAWLLVSLNLALHISEACGLKWNEFDLTKGVYASIRAKTEAHRIPRAATLWPETIAALNGIVRKSPYVFTSNRGTRFNRNKRVDSFGEFRDAAGLPHVVFDMLRDGAYTAAITLCPDERWARILVGHKSPGLQDHYVLRNPQIVRPACDAVYKTYGPFPVT